MPAAMSDWMLLGLLAAGLYLLECTRWVRSDEVACVRTGLPPRWQAREGESFFGTEEGGVATLAPWSLSGTLVTTRSWPVAFSATGVAATRQPHQNDRSPALDLIGYADAGRVRADGAQLRLDDRPWVHAGSAREAHRCVEHISRLAALPEHARERAIIRRVRNTCDDAGARRRWREVNTHLHRLERHARGLVLGLGVVTPGLLVAMGSQRAWPWLLTLIVSLNILMIRSYTAAHRSLYPADRGERWQQTLSMLLLPLASLRAADTLTRDCLAAYSLAVVLPLVCGRDGGLPLLRRRWFDTARLHDASVASTAGSAADQCRQWFAACVAHEETAVLARMGISVDEGPEPVDGALAYCPRCHAQFRSASATTCTECIAVTLVAFHASPAAAGA